MYLLVYHHSLDTETVRKKKEITRCLPRPLNSIYHLTLPFETSKTSVSPILGMRKLRLQKVRQFAQAHLPRRLPGWNWNSYLSDLKSCGLSLYIDEHILNIQIVYIDLLYRNCPGEINNCITGYFNLKLSDHWCFCIRSNWLIASDIFRECPQCGLSSRVGLHNDLRP